MDFEDFMSNSCNSQCTILTRVSGLTVKFILLVLLRWCRVPSGPQPFVEGVACWYCHILILFAETCKKISSAKPSTINCKTMSVVICLL